MVKRRGQSWLRTLVKAGTAQQKAASKMATRLVTDMLAPPKPVRKRAARKAVAAPRVRTPRAAPVAPGRWLADQCQGMAYWLYLPNAVPEDAPRNGLPLVVMLHGCYQTATQFAQGTRMNLLAERKGYAVLYPQQSLAAHPHRCWRWFDPATQAGGGDVLPLSAVLAQVLSRHPIDRRRVYVCGISAGAGMANIMALRFPGLFAAVGLHSGPVHGVGRGTAGGLRVMRHGGGLRVESAVRELRVADFPGMPAILIQGDADAVVNAVNQHQLAAQSLLLNGVPADAPVKVTRRGTRTGHEVRDYHVGRKVVLRVVRIDGLDHAWSGGDPAVAFHAKGPDASRMMLEFFGKHRR